MRTVLRREAIYPAVIAVRICETSAPMPSRTNVDADDVAEDVIFADHRRDVVDGKRGDGRAGGAVDRSCAVVPFHAVEEEAAVAVMDDDGVSRAEEASDAGADIVELNALILVEKKRVWLRRSRIGAAGCDK
jgi:hypothetical protein